MEKNDIKKALYRQKPIAKKTKEVENVYLYETSLEEGMKIYFEVPVSDMGDATFGDEMDAKLLIRWIVS